MPGSGDDARAPRAWGADATLGRLLSCVFLAAAGAGAVCLAAAECQAPVPSHYDYDEGVYTATAAAVAGGERLYRDVFLSQPPLLVLAVRGVFAVFGASVPAARALAIAAALGWVTAIVAILRARRCSWGAAGVTALLAGQAAFVVQARSVEMEGPSEALACAALWLASMGQVRRSRGWWAAAGGAAMLAAMTKFTALAVAVPLLGLVLDRGGPSRRQRAAYVGAGAAAALAVLLPVIATPAFIDQTLRFHLAVARAVPRFSEAGQSPAAHLGVIGRFLVLAWPLSAAAVVGVVVTLRRPLGSAAWGLVGWAAVEVAALTALTPLWDHHLVILFSPLGVLGGIGFERVCAGLAPARRLARPALAAALLALVAARAVPLGAQPPAQGSQDLTRLVQTLDAAVPARGTILTDDPMIAFLARRRPAGRLIDTSLTRIWAGDITEAQLAAAAWAQETGAVILWRGTFRRYFPTLWPAVAGVYARSMPMPGGRLLLLRSRPFRPDPR
jgi:hypothetical protein